MSSGGSRSATRASAVGWALLSLLVLGLLIVLLVRMPRRAPGSDAGARLLLLCAAGVQAPVAEAVARFEEETGVQVEIQYGGSGTLLSGLEVAAIGDLYLAADDSYLDLARERGCVREVIDLARQRPVVAVARGNPRGIRGLDDLLRDDVAVGLANPEAAAVGRVVRAELQSRGMWQQVSERAKVFQPTVTELANDLRLGALDAALLWDATAAQFDAVECVEIAGFEASERRIQIGVLAASQQPREALTFARYLGAPDRGLEHFAERGYRTAEGDPWDPAPKLRLYVGAMLRPAVEATLDEFEQREGVLIERVYNGCGVLTGQMELGAVPDAFFSCDVAFLEQVSRFFEPGEVFCDNRVGLLVPAGNPERLTQPKDLLRAGLKVGLAEPQKSALGALTRDLFTALEVWQPLRDSGNVAVDSATGDFLVNQMRVGSLDAAVVYRSNAAGADDLEWIALEGAEALASQPFAVAQETEHKALLARLRESLAGPESKARFERVGFSWRLAKKGAR